jgi:hypothetical protein
LTPLNNILATRAARQNLAMLKLQMEAQRLANEKMGRGGSGGSGGGSGSTPTPDEETDAELQARLAKERSASMYAAAAGNIAGLNSMISGGYQAADMGSSRPAPGRRY